MKELENEYSGAPEEIKVEIKKIISFRILIFKTYFLQLSLKDDFANTIEMESNEQKHKREYVSNFKDHMRTLFLSLECTNSSFSLQFLSVLTNA